jgi:hypothetical protein
MRLHNLKPARDIAELALSPDGQRFGVIYAHHGFHLYDAVTGAEIGTAPQYGHEIALAPTGRHMLSALRPHLRFAEVSAGRSWVPFQNGWGRDGAFNRPPAEPDTLAVPGLGYLSRVTVSARAFDRWREPPRAMTGSAGEWAHLDGAISAAHRFAVGRLRVTGQPLAVCDLAAETFVATGLDTSAATNASFGHLQFTPDGTRIIATGLSALLVFDLPPVGLSAVELPLDAPVLKPTVVIPATQPQPHVHPIPPFALLPGGQKVLMRGRNSRVELRDLATGEILTAWKWLRKVNALAVAADGLTAAAAGANGRVVIWDLS